MALISPPGNDPVDRQDNEGRNTGVNPGWRAFFNAVYTLLSGMTQSGSFTQRPENLLYVGKPFWDESLGHFVYWNGHYWSTPSGSGGGGGGGSGGGGAAFAYNDQSTVSEGEYVQGMQGARGIQGEAGYAVHGRDGEDGESFMASLTNQVMTPWRAFTANRIGWTDVGVPTVAAVQCQIERVCYFQVKITPATTVAAVAGTSYIDLPLAAAGLAGDASMCNLTTLVFAGGCVIDAANSRVYVPAQLATADVLTIAGWYNV